MENETSRTILKLENVTFKYEAQKAPTLKNINLEVRAGEFVVIAGASGSGKSTLGRLISGLIPEAFPGALTGTLTYDGQQINDESIFERSQKIGTVLQDVNAQFVGLSVAEDIAFALENDEVDDSKMHAAVAEWANRLDLGDKLQLAPQQLSGGQKQRTAMAGVLIDESPLLLLDEPLASLDEASGNEMLTLLERLRKEQGITIILIEHRLADVLQHEVDRIVILEEGEIKQDAQPAEVLQQGTLTQYGLAEPLYIQLLRAANVALPSLSGLTSPATVAGTDLKEQVQTYLNQLPKQTIKPTSEELLQVTDLSFGYEHGQLLFDHLSFSLGKSEIVTLVGKNGSGKSTLINILTGFIENQKLSGTMTLAGQDLKTLSIKERAEVMGYVIQDPNLMLTQSTVFDEVASGLRLRDVPETEIVARVNPLLELAGLYTMRNWPTDSLSYGQKKRLSIIAILVLNPAILILDEPTAGQDAENANRLMDFVRELQQSYGLTILLVTHDLGLMSYIADRTVVLVDGQILADTEPMQLLQQPDVLAQAHLAQTSLDVFLKSHDLVADQRVYRDLHAREVANES
ncbi:ATP-binding cassette domain-containing protein [Weissella viridescens]|uniref:ATP-binding cassette domain-containing protein n=1 Tax=Weissella viridescens TaxID=1629 RepID=A0A3P2RIR2_WEIVI|nr:ABC transporter ATP-binding protein [Weissella viridescens]RRG17612.1 ATP-binding cassette domain-containing protein [Weissella viridescens]